MTIIELIAGDWSGDGHNITKRRMYEVNCTAQEFEDAFHTGRALLELETHFGAGHEYYEERRNGHFNLPYCADYEEADCPSIADAIKLGLWWFNEDTGEYVPVTEDTPPTQVRNGSEHPTVYFTGYQGTDDPNDWFEVNIRVAKMARPELEVTEIKGRKISIGGYGLYNG